MKEKDKTQKYVSPYTQWNVHGETLVKLMPREFWDALPRAVFDEFLMGKAYLVQRAGVGYLVNPGQIKNLFITTGMRAPKLWH